MIEDQLMLLERLDPCADRVALPADCIPRWSNNYTAHPITPGSRTPFGTACRINDYLALIGLGGTNYPEVRRGYRRMQKWKMGEPMAYKVSQH